MTRSRKMQIICVLLLGTTLFLGSDQKEIQITGTVRNLNGGMIVYQQSIAGMMNTKTVDTLQIQSDSTFTLTLPAEDYERVSFIWYGKAVLGSVISKGGKIQLDVDVTAQEPLTIQGMDEKEVAVSRLLNQLNADVWDLRARRGDRWQIAKDTVATSVAQKLKDDAASMESQLAGLDKDLQEKARQDIRMQLLLAFQNQTMATFHRASETTRQAWFTELDQLTAFCGLDNPNSAFSPAFYDVASNEVGIRYYMRQEPMPEGVEKGIGLMYYGFEHRLQGKAQEAAMAQLFLEDQERQMNDPKMPVYAERFLQLYPETLWQPLVQEAMDKNRAFNQTQIPEDQISVKGGKGVRKTWLEGYSEVKDFYQPDYRVLPKENDYRRTLYWNPALPTDEKGKAFIRFYNNSRCQSPRITVETLTEDGKIGVFQQ